MIKILTKGYRTKPEDIVYYKKCRTCGCCFTYNKADIKTVCSGWDDVYTYIPCPDCKYYCDIIFKTKYREKKHGRIQEL